ncbi:MAG: hypothetical protein Q9176_001554 [Flavoplaca citrina]
MKKFAHLSHSANSPPSINPAETKSIITALQTPNSSSKPPPVYSSPAQPRNPPPPPPPPPSSTSDASSSPSSAAWIARDTVEKLKVFDEQAGKTLAPFYAERERRRREREPKRMEVPKEYAAEWGGLGVGGDGKVAQAEGGVKGGMVDQSRDPRLRRG